MIPCVHIRIGRSRVTLDALLALSPRYVAASCDLDLDAYFDAVERWAETEGAMYGVRVDRGAGTITRASTA